MSSVFSSARLGPFKNFKNIIPNILLTLAIASMGALAACGGGENPDRNASQDPRRASQVVGSAKVFVVGPEQGLTFGAEGVLSGSGLVRSSEPLSGTDAASSANYAVSFQMEDGGSLDVVSHAGLELENGFEISFRRTGQVLTVVLRSTGREDDRSEAFAAVDASGRLSFSIDVHNDENPAHLMIWNADPGRAENQEPLLNTGKGPRAGAPGRGSGRHWGLRLAKATAFAAAARAPRVEH